MKKLFRIVGLTVAMLAICATEPARATTVATCPHEKIEADFDLPAGRERAFGEAAIEFRRSLGAPGNWRPTNAVMILHSFWVFSEDRHGEAIILSEYPACVYRLTPREQTTWRQFLTFMAGRGFRPAAIKVRPTNP